MDDDDDDFVEANNHTEYRLMVLRNMWHDRERIARRKRR